MGVRVGVRHTGCVKELTNFLLHVLQSCIHHVDRAASLLVFRVCRFPKRRSITRKLHHVSIHHLPLIPSHQQQLSRVFQTSFLPRNTSQLLLGRRSPGIPGTDEIHNLTAGLRVYLRVSSQLGVPRKPTKGSTREASCVAGKLLRESARYLKSSSIFEPSHPPEETQPLAFVTSTLHTHHRRGRAGQADPHHRTINAETCIKP